MTTLEDLLKSPPDLPVSRYISSLIAHARAGEIMLVSAPPGSGKTTILPAVLASSLNALSEATSSTRSLSTNTKQLSRVWVTQPRRVAVRAAARHLASLLHEPVGRTVGYTVRGDSHVSSSTRIEMLTPGVLLRRLHSHPGCEGVQAIMIDEFHERHIDSDLALAFALDIRSILREDLTLVITSATLETQRTSAMISRAIGVAPSPITIDVPTYPLDIQWAPPTRSIHPLTVSPYSGALHVDSAFLEHVANTVVKAKENMRGSRSPYKDILVFLPGVREVERVCMLLRKQIDTCDILPLHGRISAASQDAIVRTRGARPRIIVSTALAESSLTVPGVSVVVDACLSREPRTDAVRGISGLVTVPASRDQCEQRAGRAARLGPGIAIRCINESDWPRRPSHSLPEIVTGDLTDAALQAGAWGESLSELSLLDSPPEGPLRAAFQRLRGLEALDSHNRITSAGKLYASLPLSPSLARALVYATHSMGPRRGAEVVADVNADIRPPGADLGNALRSLYTSSIPSPAQKRIKEETRHLTRVAEKLAFSHLPTMEILGGESTVKKRNTSMPVQRSFRRSDNGNASPLEKRFRFEDDLAEVIAYAYPDQIVKKRPLSDSYISVNGQGSVLPQPSPLRGEEWLAVALLTRDPGHADAVIRSACPLTEQSALDAAAAFESTHISGFIRSGRVQARKIHSLGSIELESHMLSTVPPEVGAPLVKNALEREGTKLFSWTPRAILLRRRMAFLHANLHGSWPGVEDSDLLSETSSWLQGILGDIVRGAPFSSVDMHSALRTLLPWPEAIHLNDLAPVQLTIPTGAHKNLDWSGDTPVLSLRVQEAFGWKDTPRLAGGKVSILIHLLDPAGRPVAITSDLASFWAGSYKEVRAELRGRYPRHSWPEDPLTAQPTGRAIPRSNR